MPGPVNRWMFVRALFVMATAAAVSAGCRDGGPTTISGPGAYTLRIVNDGQVELRELFVMSSESDSMRVGTLAAGASVSYTGVRAVHEHLLVSATAGGQPVGQHPIEGFVPGFNAVLPAGAYEARLRSDAGGFSVSLAKY